MSFIDYLMSWYDCENYFDLAFYIIFLTFVAFVIELCFYVNIIEIIKMLTKKKENVEKTEQNSFFIEGINDLEDYDIFTPLNEQEP